MCSDVGAELIQVDSLEENDIIVSMASKQETQLSKSLTSVLLVFASLRLCAQEKSHCGYK